MGRRIKCSIVGEGWGRRVRGGEVGEGGVCMVITSYSCEKRRLSLAFRRSMWSDSSQTEMGGCSLIPGEERQKRKT